MNKKGFINIIIIILLVAVLSIAGYFVWSNWSSAPTPTAVPTPSSPIPTDTPTPKETPTSWQFVDANSFTLSLPPGWTFNKLQGIDSYVGEFIGDGAKLGFDYGWYSNSLAEDNDPDHIVTYETIDGYRAKIVVPKVTGTGTTGVYFADLGGESEKTRLQISGRNLTESQQETSLKIFRTIEIVR